MITLGLIGLVGGLIAGVSPCILPVLPVILMSSTAVGAEPGPTVAARRDLTPYLVIAGLALSFSVFTLLGALALSALPLPNDVIRWTGLVVLVLLGIGMIVPAVERTLEIPFARLAPRSGAGNRRGFVLGLALGAVYVPCAGPVLAAITVAGATGEIGWQTITLTVAFAVGTSIPLLAFALAGRRIADRITAFRSRQRTLRTVGGLVVIGLAVALTFNLTDAIQRAVPDYTDSLSKAAGTEQKVRSALAQGENQPLSLCAARYSADLRDCGAAPKIEGITSWFNTPGDRALVPQDFAGKVVLIDFWAYSCINCQRASPHLEAWSQQYRDDGLVVVGVHAPEYAFEHQRDNVIAGARRLGITYPVALDNDFTTWSNFENTAWPTEYLIDANGTLRYVSIGEGDYDATERAIRSLLMETTPDQGLGATTEVPDRTPQEPQSAETYLGSQRGTFYRGTPELADGIHQFRFPDQTAPNAFSLSGQWAVGPESLTAGAQARLRQNFVARTVYLNVGGTGTMTVSFNGTTTRFQVGGAPNIYPILEQAKSTSGVLEVRLSRGLQVYSFTFG